MALIEANDLIVVDMLVTSDFYPLPHEAVILKSFGKKKVVETNKGSVEGYTEGDRLKIELSAISFAQWLNMRSFWMMDTESGKLKKMSIKVEPA